MTEDAASLPVVRIRAAEPGVRHSDQDLTSGQSGEGCGITDSFSFSAAKNGEDMVCFGVGGDGFVNDSRHVDETLQMIEWGEIYYSRGV